MKDVHRCAVCNEPASAVLVIGSTDTNELRIGVCQEHGFEMAHIRVVMEELPKGKKR